MDISQPTPNGMVFVHLSKIKGMKSDFTQIAKGGAVLVTPNFR
jgi:hypothetical protein